jgi:hypothetical protein
MVKILASAERVVRYVGGLHYNHETGVVDGSAYGRRKNDDDGLSFTRRYIVAVDDETDKNQIRRIFASRLKIGKTAVFAQFSVADALDALSDYEEAFDFIENELEAEGQCLANPAHALLRGLPFVGEAVGSLKSEVAGDLLASRVDEIFHANPE